MTVTSFSAGQAWLPDGFSADVARRCLPAACVVVFVNVSADLSRPDGNFLNVQRLGG